MGQTRMQLNFDAKFEIKESLNNEFTLAKCTVMGLGKNRNFTHISKEAAEDAEYSLFNIPIIGHIFKNKDGKWQLGGHDMILEEDSKTGGKIFKSICVPYGVVPANAKIEYRDVVEGDGTVRTYLITDVILWTGRFPEILEIAYDDEIYCNESMEINILNSEKMKEDSKYLDIKKYTYSALCMLQKADDESNAEPCFPESKITIGNFEKLMDEFKHGLFSYYNTTKGGVPTMKISEEARDKILSKFNLSVDDLDFEITEDMTESDFSQIVKAKRNEIDQAQFRMFAATYKEKAKALKDALVTEFVEDENGNIIYMIEYIIIDFDDKFVYVRKYSYQKDSHPEEKLYRFKYNYNDDEKSVIVEKETGEAMVMKLLTIEEEKKIEDARTEYTELKTFKETVLKKEKEAEYDAVLTSNEFSSISETEEFKAIIAKAYDFADITALKKECYAILGMVSAKQKPSANSNKTAFGLKASIGKSEGHIENEYEDFYNKYKERK